MPSQTPSEARLADLCKRAFHSLWTFPNPHRGAKELCDSLLLFEDRAVVFSIKECAVDREIPIELAWNRWVETCVFASADQALGAGRKLKDASVVIHTGSDLREQIPLRNADRSSLRIHYVVAALGAADACRTHAHTNGSLRLRFSLPRQDHLFAFDRSGELVGTADRDRLFTIGDIGIAGRYVHVLDDTSLEAVLETLDTVQDFLRYLDRKEAAIAHGQIVGADGEEQLLAYYSQRGTQELGHDFVFDQPNAKYYLGPAWWPEFKASPHRARQVAADAPSYGWDRMIERIAANAEEWVIPRIEYGARERALTFLGRETRLRRRFLIQAYNEAAAASGRLHFGIRRAIPTGHGEPLYAFLTTPESPRDPDPIDTRRRCLEIVCMSLAGRFREHQDIIGIAPSNRTPEQPEDIMFVDTRSFNDNDWQRTEQAQKLLDTLGPLEPSVSVVRASEFFQKD